MPTFVPEFCKVEFTTMSESINHPGIVERVEGHFVSVRITQYSACAECHVKSACSAADRKDKVMVIEDHSGEYHEGDSVWIVGQTSLGMQACPFGFWHSCHLVACRIACRRIIRNIRNRKRIVGFVHSCRVLSYIV